MYVCMYVCMYVYIYIYMYMCVYVCIYTHIFRPREHMVGGNMALAQSPQTLNESCWNHVCSNHVFTSPDLLQDNDYYQS